MDRLSQVLGHLEASLDEGTVDDQLRLNVGELGVPPSVHLLAHPSKFCCIWSTPMESAFCSEKCLECLARTGWKSPEKAMFSQTNTRYYAEQIFMSPPVIGDDLSASSSAGPPLLQR